MFCRAALMSTLLTGLTIAAVSMTAQGVTAQGVAAQEMSDEPAGEPADNSFEIAWETFVSDSGQFQVAMPSQPAVYAFAPESNAAGSLMYMQMQLAGTDRLEIYAAAFITSADFVTSREAMDTALLSCVSSLSEQALQTVPQMIALGEYQGIEVEFRDDSGLLQISRCYLVDDRAYLLTASSEPFNAGAGLVPLGSAMEPAGEESAVETIPTETVRSPTMEAFFDSFAILD